MCKELSSIIYDPVELLQRHDSENKLERYYQLLLEENKRLNLVSRETCVARSIDSAVRCPHLTASKRTECRVGAPDTTLDFAGLRMLAAQSLLPLEKIKLDTIGNYLDIGSGGGFPAIPILLTQKVRHTTLVERTKKKAGALRRILLALDLKADILSQSFEDLTSEPLFDLITLRQVKLTSLLFENIHAVIRSGGVFIYYNATDIVPPEISTQKLTYEYTTSSDDSGGKFTIFQKCR